MKRPPLAHRIIKPQPYVPALHSDVRKTIAKARKALAQQQQSQPTQEQQQ